MSADTYRGPVGRRVGLAAHRLVAATSREDDIRILIIEDDAAIAKLVRLTLERDDYDVVHAASGAQGLDLVREWAPDVVLLDLMLPDLNGCDVAREIRLTSDTPIVMVTALGHERDRVEGLDAGADDYIVKPFSTAELKARLRALIRRSDVARRGVRALTLRVGDIILDVDDGRVVRGKDEIALTKRESELLRMLMAQPGKVISRATLAHTIWGRDASSAANVLDVHVSALRRKLDDDASRPVYIETVRGRGFRIRTAEVQP